MSLSEHQDQISADKLSNNMEVIPPISLTYATAVVLSERIPICNDFLCVKNVFKDKKIANNSKKKLYDVNIHLYSIYHQQIVH